MSDEQEQLTVLQQLNKDLNNFKAQREQAQLNFQQLTGAIYGIEMAIKKINEMDTSKNIGDELMQQDEHILNNGENNG